MRSKILPDTHSLGKFSRTHSLNWLQMILDSLSNNVYVFSGGSICYLPSQVIINRPAIMKFILRELELGASAASKNGGLGACCRGNSHDHALYIVGKHPILENFPFKEAEHHE